MGDQSDATIQCYDVARFESELDELLAPFRCELVEYGGVARIAFEALDYGCDEPICAALRERQISYEFFQCADHEHTASTRLYTPELGEWSGPANADGEPLIAASNLDTILEQMPADADDVWLREELDVASAAAWRGYFAGRHIECVRARQAEREVQ